MWGRLALMRERALSHHAAKTELMENYNATRNIGVNVSHINKIVPNSTFNCKRQIFRSILADSGLQADLLPFRDNGRLEGVRKLFNQDVIEQTGFASNGANPDMLRVNLPKFAQQKLEKSVGFVREDFLKEKLE